MLCLTCHDRWRAPFASFALVAIILSFFAAIIANSTVGWIKWTLPVVDNASFTLASQPSESGIPVFYAASLTVTVDTSSFSVGLWSTCSSGPSGSSCTSTTNISENDQGCAAGFVRATNAARALLVIGLVFSGVAGILCGFVLRYRYRATLTGLAALACFFSFLFLLAAMILIRVSWGSKQICGNWFKPKGSEWSYSYWFGIGDFVFAMVGFSFLIQVRRIDSVPRDPYGIAVEASPNRGAPQPDIIVGENGAQIVVGIPLDEKSGSNTASEQPNKSVSQ